MNIDVIWRHGIEEPVSNGRLCIRLNGSAAEIASRDMAGCAGAPEFISQARSFYLVVEGEVIATVARKSAQPQHSLLRACRAAAPDWDAQTGCI